MRSLNFLCYSFWAVSWNEISFCWFLIFYMKHGFFPPSLFALKFSFTMWLLLVSHIPILSFTLSFHHVWPDLFFVVFVSKFWLWISFTDLSTKFGAFMVNIWFYPLALHNVLEPHNFGLMQRVMCCHKMDVHAPLCTEFFYLCMILSRKRKSCILRLHLFSKTYEAFVRYRNNAVWNL